MVDLVADVAILVVQVIGFVILCIVIKRIKDQIGSTQRIVETYAAAAHSPPAPNAHASMEDVWRAVESQRTSQALLDYYGRSSSGDDHADVTAGGLARLGWPSRPSGKSAPDA
jgi:hypothetical protein